MKYSGCSINERRFSLWTPPVVKLGGHLPICPGCLRVGFLIYEKLLSRCEDCFTLVPLPWETECSNCFYRNYGTGVRYSGLQASSAPTLRTYWQGPAQRILAGMVAIYEDQGYRTWLDIMVQDQDSLGFPEKSVDG